ncbi:MAG: hypothetical protein AAFQ66_22200 [Pseudomonadota bacterium]
MTRTFTFCAALILTAPVAIAQEQQAGNEASTNAEETFQQLVEQCDNTDMLMLRAKVRLQLSRTTEEAAAQAQGLMEEGFALCGDGDMDTATAKLEEALAVSSEGASEKFGTDASATVEPASEETTAEAQPAEDEQSGPWWKFW